MAENENQSVVKKKLKGVGGVINEFKTFISRGNVLDMAVGVIVGGAFTSIVNAIIAAPNTINGERKKSLNAMFTPDCSWFISLVIRVIIVDVPIPSISVNESDSICLNKAYRRLAANPVAAFAAKNCAVIEHVSPIIASSTKIPPYLNIYPLSFNAIPLSIIDAITRGTARSKHASSSLKNGPSIHSLVYSLI